MDCGLLPDADRQLLDYDSWLQRRLDGLAGHPHQQLLRQFGVWYQLARMRARAASGPLRPTARQYAERRFTTACSFLTWVHDRGGHPARLTQADLDAWHATCPAGQRPASRAFLTWAMDSGHMARLDLPVVRFGTGEAITQQQRIALLRRYALTDQDPLRIRAAACLMLLYAQPLSRVLRFTLTGLDQQPGGQLWLRIGEPASPVPEPFAQVLLLQAAHAALASTWLFPGRNPGQPAAYITVFNQLRSLGFPMRTGRIPALRELAAQAPASGHRRRPRLPPHHHPPPARQRRRYLEPLRTYGHTGQKPAHSPTHCRAITSSPGQRSRPDQACRHWRLGPAACPVRLDPPGALASHHADGFVQRGAHVVQADAVLCGIPARERTAGDQVPVDAAPGLIGEVVVDAVAEWHQAESVSERRAS